MLSLGDEPMSPSDYGARHLGWDFYQAFKQDFGLSLLGYILVTPSGRDVYVYTLPEETLCPLSKELDSRLEGNS